MFFFRGKKTLWGRKKGTKPLTVMLLVLCLLTASLLLGSPDRIGKVYSLVVPQTESLNLIISEGLPLAAPEGDQASPAADLLPWLISLLTGINSANPAEILCEEMNLSWERAASGLLLSGIIYEQGGEEDYYLPGQDEELDEWISIPEEEIPPVQLDGEPMILIYTTHNAESYKPSDGSSRLEGKNGGIAAIASLLAKNIESKYALKTIYSDVIHDYPDYTMSYTNSMRTVQQILKKYQKIQLVLDIHRDAGFKTRSDTLVKINGKNCAKILIVVGTEHSRWKENLAFAEKLEAKANALYPGLVKSIMIREDRRYNQHLHPRALLLEFGSDLNTREDAANSAEMMAEVIAAVLTGK